MEKAKRYISTFVQRHRPNSNMVLDNRGIEVRFLSGVRYFSLLYNVMTGCGAHLDS
jgi:hypothetical protein